MTAALSGAGAEATGADARDPDASGLDASGLDATVQVELGTFSVSANVRVAAGETLAIIGANGSGKSTLLASIAGSQRIDTGRIRLAGRTLTRRGTDGMNGADGTVRTSGAVVDLRRADRRIGLLDQRALLFPHLDARANIAFAPRAHGSARRAADRTADEWLERVGLPARGSARARDLSGGQQQRVAIARTLASEPELLLLDEPFAALDVTSRAELRALVAAETRRLGIPVVIVSHDPLDLIALADRVLVLESGRVAQEGSVAAVLESPATPFAAAFTGRGLLHGTVRHAADPDARLELHDAPLAELRGRGALPAPGTPAVASFDPAQVRIEAAASANDAASASAANTWCGTVGEVSTGPAGIRVACAEWPEAWAVLPLARALDPWLAPGAPAVWHLPEADVRFATPA